ncbi:MAG: tRNA (adenosine(37)-N6)-threonylcarbamoyltransferase complex dimerization subunit type 1 TsaB [Candidatus Nanopelagicales bacterium]
MLLLALDTATPAVTVAVHDGEHLLAESLAVDSRRHGELVAPGIARVLLDAGVTARDLTHVAVGVGPGPFTGLRVGLVTARVLSATLAIPLHGVCTLDVLAADVTIDGPFVVATDARRREVYVAEYAGPADRSTDPTVRRPTDLALELRALPCAGEGPRLYPDELPNGIDPQLPRAGTLAALVRRRIDAGGAGLLPAHPLYLRRPDAAEPGRRKSVLA